MLVNCEHQRAINPVPLWDLWFPTQTPVVPEIYWNVVSQEQRYKQLCCTLAALIDYSKLLANGINEVSDEVAEQLKEQSAWVTEQIALLRDELTKLIEQVTGTSFDWDVLQGQADATQTAHRALYWWLTPNGLTCEDFNSQAPSMTVAELAESGINCQGWAQYGGSYIKLGISSVPVYYKA